MLTPLVRDSRVARPTQAALFNLVGCCSCLNQDFEGGIRYFNAAAKLTSANGTICQNLALVHEWLDQLAQADPHWNRYFDQFDSLMPAPPDVPFYREHLAFEGLVRLANSYCAKEKWPPAVSYLQRAQRLRSADTDLLERLFHLYIHARRPDNARRTLQQLRELRPNDPLHELYELDAGELRNVDDVERLLGGINGVMQRHPGDPRVAERAGSMAGNLVPWMRNLRRNWASN